MANRYNFELPYSCTMLGKMRGFVYADSVEEAMEMLEGNWTYDDEYIDTEGTNYQYYFEEANITIEEENVIPPNMNLRTKKDSLPTYFLSEVKLL